MCRRYAGHKRTIRPNVKKLSSLFKTRNQMEWEVFSRKVKLVQRGFMGEPDEMRPGRGDFHEFPASCICKIPQQLVTDGSAKEPGGDKTTRKRQQLKRKIVETSWESLNKTKELKLLT